MGEYHGTLSAEERIISGPDSKKAMAGRFLSPWILYDYVVQGKFSNIYKWLCANHSNLDQQDYDLFIEILANKVDSNKPMKELLIDIKNGKYDDKKPKSEAQKFYYEFRKEYYDRMNKEIIETNSGQEENDTEVYRGEEI